MHITFEEARAQYATPEMDEKALNGQDQAEAFKNCLRLFAGVRKTRAVNSVFGSYAMKHWVESMYPGVYVYEGTCVLAAVALGFNRWPARKDVVSSHFNMSNADLRFLARMSAKQ
jgi:hypothetical protein